MYYTDTYQKKTEEVRLNPLKKSKVLSDIKESKHPIVKGTNNQEIF